MIYKAFSEYSNKGSLYLDSSLKPKQIEDILISIQFMFEELVTDNWHVEETQFIPVLETFFSDNIKIIKDTDFNKTDLVYKIDLFDAREKRCSSKIYNCLMAEPILKTKDYQNLIKKIKYK